MVLGPGEKQGIPLWGGVVSPQSSLTSTLTPFPCCDAGSYFHQGLLHPMAPLSLSEAGQQQ